MEGLLEEGSELIEEEPDQIVLDAGLISAAQRVEHYEISAYGTAVEWARLLAVSVLVVPLVEVEKLVVRRRALRTSDGHAGAPV